MTDPKKVTKLSWRRFLQTDAGMEGMLFLRERVPSISKGQPHEVQFDAGRSEGYKQCLDTIMALLSVEETKEVDASND